MFCDIYPKPPVNSFSTVPSNFPCKRLHSTIPCNNTQKTSEDWQISELLSRPPNVFFFLRKKMYNHASGLNKFNEHENQYCVLLDAFLVFQAFKLGTWLLESNLMSLFIVRRRTLAWVTERSLYAGFFIYVYIKQNVCQLSTKFFIRFKDPLCVVYNILQMFVMASLCKAHLNA